MLENLAFFLGGLALGYALTALFYEAVVITTSTSYEELSDAFDKFKVALGNELTPPIEKMLDAMAKLIDRQT